MYKRQTDRKPSDIPFNTGEGLRAAYYVQDDAGKMCIRDRDIQAANVINGETNRAIQGANQSFNCADANIRGTPTILLPTSCGGPWPNGMAPQ